MFGKSKANVEFCGVPMSFFFVKGVTLFDPNTIVFRQNGRFFSSISLRKNETCRKEAIFYYGESAVKVLNLQ